MGALGRRAFLLALLGSAAGPATARAAAGVSALIAELELGEYLPPRPVVDFTLPALSGGPLAMSDFRGKAVLIHFWTTWCQPCKWELPLLEQLYRRHRDEGFVVLGISIDSSRDLVERYIREKDYTFPVALDADREVGDRFRVLGVPGTFIVTADGYLKAKGFGPRAWDSAPAHALVETLVPARSRR